MLTDTACRKTSPTEKMQKLADGKGLYLWIYPDGKKYWRLRYWVHGKEKSLSMGVYPEVSLKDARTKRDEQRAILDQGLDPSAERQAKKLRSKISADRSFEAIAREWHAAQCHQWTERYAANMVRRLEADIFPRIGARPIAEITAAEVLEVLQSIESRGASDLAHRMQQVCGQVFTYAVVTLRAPRNPVLDIRGALKPTVKTSYAYLRESELPEFWEKLEAYDGHPQTKLAIEFLALTFVRTAEMRGATWKELDIDKTEWRIPAERMKKRREHWVPLSTQALAVIEKLRPYSGHREFLFPNLHKPMACMSENTVLYALYRMGYHSRATGHGFRSTASTILHERMHEHGIRSEIIERQLAHVDDNRVRAAYNHAEYWPDRQKLMQWWADHFHSLKPAHG